jgi:lysophospholipase L1-like esterase
MTRPVSRITRCTLAFSALAISALFLGTAEAEGPVGLVDQPCPAPLVMPAAMSDAVEAMLVPGPVDLAGMMKRLDQPEINDYRKESAERSKQDWPNLCRYRFDNGRITQKPKVVFMGDSITELWGVADPALFTHGLLDRGISGQTTPQMLLRFFGDVINLHPVAVHILAGTNDIAGNTGPSSVRDFQNNIEAMVELARTHKIRVLLGSIPPAARFTWRPELTPIDTIRTLNDWLKSFAASNGIQYIDYYSALVDGQNGFKAALSADGVHPNRDGYALMKPLTLAAIRDIR